MQKFQGKYRIPSARAPFWDYSRAGAYFVTICTKNRFHYFGEITDGTMVVSPIGAIADVLWYETKHHAKNVKLGAFVVMPNHVHGIVQIISDEENSSSRTVGTRHALSLQQQISSDNSSAPISAETRHTLSLLPQQPESPAQRRFQNQGKNSLSSIIGSYKSAVSKHAHRLGFDFAWQSRFHDHIIRNEESYYRIMEYIVNNPKQWQEDTYFSV